MPATSRGFGRGPGVLRRLLALALALVMPLGSWAHAAENFGRRSEAASTFKATAAVQRFFASPRPRYGAMRPLLSYLGSLKPGDPVSRPDMAAAVGELQAAAERLLPGSPEAAPPEGFDSARAERLALLHHPWVRAHLSVRQRAGLDRAISQLAQIAPVLAPRLEAVAGWRPEEPAEGDGKPQFDAFFDHAEALRSSVAGAAPRLAPSVATANLLGRGRHDPAVREAAGIELLRRTQEVDGSWTAPMRTSSIGYNTNLIFLYQLLGLRQEKEALVRGLMSYVWSQQLPSGGFPTYPGGAEGDSLNVQAYLAAKIAGEPEDAERMLLLERRIIERKSLEKARRVKPYLMLMGLRPLPRLPPGSLAAALLLEPVLPWLKVVLYPVLYLASSGNVTPLEPGQVPRRIGLESEKAAKPARPLGGAAFFRWLERTMNSDGTLFDYLPTSTFALLALASRDGAASPRVRRGLATLESFVVEVAAGALYASPGVNQVGESALMVLTLLDLGLSPEDPMIRRASSFLLRARHENGAFGNSDHNEHFPDSDSTAAAILALTHQARIRGDAALEGELSRSLNWILGLQNRDGGFGTWEPDRTPWLSSLLKRFLGKRDIVLSESVAEHTARIAAVLSLHRQRDPRVARAHDRAVEWLLTQQRPDGSFRGTWLVNHLPGTAMVVGALATKGEDPRTAAAIERGLAFLAGAQRPDGGFSEDPESFTAERYLPLPASSPVQTGIVLIPLLTAFTQSGRPGWSRLEALAAKAAGYLRRSRGPDGRWRDKTWSAVNFPKYEYLIYPFIQEFAPLHALALYERSLGRSAISAPDGAAP